MSKFKMIAGADIIIDDVKFPTSRSKPVLNHRLLQNNYNALGNKEFVKQCAGWDANSVGCENIKFLRRCTSDHLEAILRNVKHIQGTFTVDIIGWILEECKSQ